MDEAEAIGYVLDECDLDSPRTVVVDKAGNVWAADRRNDTVTKIPTAEPGDPVV